MRKFFSISFTIFLKAQDQSNSFNEILSFAEDLKVKNKKLCDLQTLTCVSRFIVNNYK